jgi:hypothetical protein
MMSRASVLARGQAAAAAGMVDTCVIKHRTGDAMDPLSGTITPTYSTLYTGRCRVQQTQAAFSRPHEAGEDFVLMARMDVQLPVAGTEGLHVDDEVTITAVGTGRDADLVGRVFLVHDLFHKTDATARRVGVVERTGS